MWPRGEGCGGEVCSREGVQRRRGAHRTAGGGSVVDEAKLAASQGCRCDLPKARREAVARIHLLHLSAQRADAPRRHGDARLFAVWAELVFEMGLAALEADGVVGVVANLGTPAGHVCPSVTKVGRGTRLEGLRKQVRVSQWLTSKRDLGSRMRSIVLQAGMPFLGNLNLDSPWGSVHRCRQHSRAISDRSS